MGDASEPAKPNGMLRTALFLTRLAAAAAMIALLAFVIMRPTSPTAIASENVQTEAPAPAPAPAASIPVEAPTTSAFDEALKLRGRWARNAEDCARLPLTVEVTRDERGERIIWNSNTSAAEQIFRLDDNDGVVTRVGGWEYRYRRVDDHIEVRDPTDPEVTILIACS
jgi:hypothetical protein